MTAEDLSNREKEGPEEEILDVIIKRESIPNWVQELTDKGYTQDQIEGLLKRKSENTERAKKRREMQERERGQ